MTIGIFKEPENENRVVLLPESVAELVKMNVQVLVESEAGMRSFASNSDYEAAGAKVISKDEVFDQSGIVMRICPVGEDELLRLKPKQTLINVLNPLLNYDLVKRLVDKDVTSFSLDVVPRTTRAQAMDVLSSMATVSGYKAVLAAANHLPNFFPMFMSAAGTIRPSKVLILGAGVAGLQAIATARKLGAVVEAFDVRLAAKEEVLSLGAKFVEVEGAIDDESAGGYAVEQTEEYKQKQQALIQEHAKKSNVVICTAQIPGRKAPLLITRDTVENMPQGAVIVDLAASTGGNCEVTENNKTINYKGVTIIGNSNLASDLPVDASKMFGKNVINFLKLFFDKEGNFNMDFEDDLIAGTCVTRDKEIVNERVKEAMMKV